jgi:quercetin dioxygenase-like cupin family protein
MSEAPAPSPVIRWGPRIEPTPIPGITAAAVYGQRLSAALYRLEPGAVVPRHSHHNEEFGQVVRGALELGVDGEVCVLTEGEAFVIPGGMPHAARALDAGCELLECYAPPRAPASTEPMEDSA